MVVGGCKHRPLSSSAPLDTTTPPAASVIAPQPEPVVEPLTEAMLLEPIVAPIVESPVIETVTPLEPLEAGEPVEPALPSAEAPTLALPPGPVSVALLLPLSGPSAELGAALFDAAQLALFDVGNLDMVLLPRDTQGTPEGAAAAAGMALADGARLIVGPLFAGSVAAVAPLARATGVNVVAFSSDRSVARPGVYLMGFLPAQQVERVVGYAARRGLRWFTALAPSSPYGQAMVEALSRAARAKGALLVDPVYYPADAETAAEVKDIVRFMANYDARRAALLAERQRLIALGDEASLAALAALEDVDTLGATGFEAVLLPEGGPRLLTIAPLFPYYDLDAGKVRLLGTSQWETAALASEPALHGGWYAAPPPAARADFEARFAATFGYPPPRLATLAYDAVALAGALARLPGGRGFTSETLTSPGGFRGVDGIFRFTADGANQRGLAVLEVTAEGAKTIDEAPVSFAGY